MRQQFSHLHTLSMCGAEQHKEYNMIINQIVSGGGSQPTGTTNITTNGTHDVAAYEYANVNVPTSAPFFYIEKQSQSGTIVNTSHLPDFSWITAMPDYALAYSFYNNTAVSGAVDLSNLTSISNSSLWYTFYGCTGITSADLSSLETVGASSSLHSTFSRSGIQSLDMSSLKTASGGNALQAICANCGSLTSVDISSLETVGGSLNSAFQNTKLASIDVSRLTTVNGTTGLGSTFRGITTLTTCTFDSLSTITGTSALSHCFRDCTHLTTLFFPAFRNKGTATNQFSMMLSGVTGCTVHFPSNMQSVIGTWSDVTAGFSGTNTTVLFDLPATSILNGANSIQYERNPKYDTANALSWRVAGSSVTTTAYYTSGLTDPAVNDTIYSDAACTTAETTISTIV